MNYAALLNLANESHCILNKDLEMVFINESFIRTIRTEVGNLPTYHFLDWIVDSEKENIRTIIQNAKPNWNIPVSLTMINKRQEIFTFTGKFYFDGQNYYFCGNIAVQQQGYSSLLGRFRRHFDISLIQLLLILDNKYHISYISPELARKLQYEPEKLINKNFLDFLFKDDTQEASVFLGELSLQEGKTVQKILRLTAQDGSLFWFSWLMIYNRTHFLTIASDLTLLKENEQTLIEKNTELLDSENKLKATLHELELRNAELDTFTYQISHNLRSPITSTMGLINLIRTDSTEPYLNYLEKIELSIKKLDRGIHSLQDHYSGAREKIIVEQINFDYIIKGALDNIKKFHTQTPEMQVQIDSQVPFFSDPIKIDVIFRSLITNSIEYQHHSSLHAIIAIHIVQKADYTTIFFQDNGIGIDSNFMNKAFDMYERGENSGGAGLGLYIVKQTVEKLGGEIRMNSIIHKGTNFHISLKNMTADFEAGSQK